MTTHRTPLTNEFRMGIIPAETKGIRKEPMTWTEFDAELAKNRDELLRKGEPLVRTDLLGYGEKAGRVAEAERKENADAA